MWLVVASNDPDHDPMIHAAKPFFDQLAAQNNFQIEFTRDAKVNY